MSKSDDFKTELVGVEFFWAGNPGDVVERGNGDHHFALDVFDGDINGSGELEAFVIVWYF